VAGIAISGVDEDYQSIKQFPHLGTMKIGMERGERKRVAGV
jgi:hypothetical protein